MDSDFVDHTSFEGDGFVCDLNLVSKNNIGPKTEKRNRDMLQVEQIMQDAGWFDESPNGPAEVGDLAPVLPAQLQSGKDWTAIVQCKRQELIDERCKNIPDKIDDINKTGYDQESLAEVKIIDKSYLSAKFKAKVKKEQDIIDSVSDFILNTDQERAFCIIANHASTEKPEQLLMYIDGMAGTGKSQVIKAQTAFFER